MAKSNIYRPEYSGSHALIIGINEYNISGPLDYARQDAEAFAKVLQDEMGFSQENIRLLLDHDATRESIMRALLEYAKRPVGVDDRIVMFFAGHGCTKTGARGEVGYLVPVEGDIDDLITLIRWDDLTRNSELIPAKHILFIMDACYGGLAVMRTPPSGSSRFVQDMMQRYSRQVLTAGKDDEPVADSGGPRPGHSIFTGHLLNALEGGAASTDGLITANAIMAYVYDRVSRDPHSNQTPHYGFIDGDGDFVFTVPKAKRGEDPGKGSDTMIQLPAILTPPKPEHEPSLSDILKDYLSDSKFRIRLDDLVSEELRLANYELSEEKFPSNSPKPTPEEFAHRLRAYEQSMSRISIVVDLISRWAMPEHQPVLNQIIVRLAETASGLGGYQYWLDMRWYPLMRIMYSGGIAALSSGNYVSLSTLLTSTVAERGRREPEPVVIPTVSHINGVDLFKSLPGHERHFAPRSEYMFGSVQPQIEDLLFLGSSYEMLFDRFEVLYALVCADLRQKELGPLWGPPGRFGWKYIRDGGPFDRLVSEAKAQVNSWAPLKAGLFSGSAERFVEIANEYRENVLNRLGWI
jgi:hypothetical protein